MLKIRHKKIRIIVTLINALGTALFTFLSFFTFNKFYKNVDLKSTNDILIMQLAGIGDAVLSISTFRCFRENYPYAHITLVVSRQVKEILKNCPYYDEIFSCEHILHWQRNGFMEIVKLLRLLRRKKIDLAIDLKGDSFTILLMFLAGAKYRVSYDITGGGFLLTHIVPYKNNKHEVEHYLDIARFLGAKITDKSLEMWSTKKDRVFIENLLRKNNIKESDLLIGIHPGARWYYRQWNKKYYAQLADILSENHNNVKIVFLEDPKDTNLVEDILSLTKKKHLAIRLTLEQVVSFLEICDIFIGNDGGPAHIATAIKTPTVVLFGPEDPARFAPYGDNCIVIYKKLPCSPCDQTKCRRPENSCMDLITVDEVFKEIEKLLSKIRFVELGNFKDDTRYP